jgi:hypothetical protein
MIIERSVVLPLYILTLEELDTIIACPCAGFDLEFTGITQAHSESVISNFFSIFTGFFSMIFGGEFGTISFEKLRRARSGLLWKLLEKCSKSPTTL